MKASSKESGTIDEYIADFPGDVREMLEKIRATIHEAAPEATEAIKYRMPTFVLHGNLVHFAAFKNHIGFYPAPRALEEFKEELAGYEGAKGSVRFPFGTAIPLDLIRRIVELRVEGNLRKAAANVKKQ